MVGHLVAAGLDAHLHLLVKVLIEGDGVAVRLVLCPEFLLQLEEAAVLFVDGVLVSFLLAAPLFNLCFQVVPH